MTETPKLEQAKSFMNIEHNSERGAILTLMTTGIGAVCLSLPLVLQEAGFLLGLVIIQLTGLVSLMAMHSVSKATHRTGIAEYLEVCEHLLGHTTARIVAILIVIFTMEHLLLYEIMVARLFFHIFPNLFPYRTSIILYFNILVLLQLSLLKTLKALKFVTCMSFIGLGFITVILTIELPNNPELEKIQTMEYAKWGTGIFTGMAICMVSFICPTNVGPVHKELRFATRRRMKRINHTIIAIEQILYSVLAVVGYLNTISATPEVITERPTQGKTDVLMTIGAGIMCIALIVDIPTFVPHCSSSIETLLHWHETHVLHVPLTALTMFIPVLFTIYNLDLGFLLSLIAAQAAWFFYFVPGSLYTGVYELKVSTHHWTYPKNLCYITVQSLFTLVMTWSVFSYVWVDHGLLHLVTNEATVSVH